jgi:hypothetical protein
MSKTATLEKIIEELDFLKKKILSIEEHMVDIDSILTEGDLEALLDYRKEKTEGDLIPHEALKAELGL